MSSVSKYAEFDLRIIKLKFISKTHRMWHFVTVDKYDKNMVNLSNSAFYKRTPFFSVVDRYRTETYIKQIFLCE